MENSEISELPREEAIVRLLELTNRYGVGLARDVSAPITESERHRREFGHPLRFGCCKALTEPQAA